MLKLKKRWKRTLGFNGTVECAPAIASKPERRHFPTGPLGFNKIPLSILTTPFEAGLTLLIFGRDNEQASESVTRTGGAPKCETEDMYMFNFNAFPNKRFKIRQNTGPVLRS